MKQNEMYFSCSNALIINILLPHVFSRKTFPERKYPDLSPALIILIIWKHNLKWGRWYWKNLTYFPDTSKDISFTFLAQLISLSDSIYCSSFSLKWKVTGELSSKVSSRPIFPCCFCLVLFWVFLVVLISDCLFTCRVINNYTLGSV